MEDLLMSLILKLFTRNCVSHSSVRPYSISCKCVIKYIKLLNSVSSSTTSAALIIRAQPHPIIINYSSTVVRQLFLF